MTLDARMLLAGRGVEAPDWLGDAARASALSNLAQTRRLQMDAARRAEESQRNIGEALGQVDVTDDFQVRRALTTMPPESRQAFLSYVDEQRNKIAAAYKTRAEGDASVAKTKADQFGFVARIAGDLASRPMDADLVKAWQAGKANLRAAGIDPSLLDVPDGADPIKHFAHLAGSSLSQKDRLDAENKAAGLKLTERGQDITMRGQDMTASTAAAGHGVTMRGQDIGANTAAAGHALTRRGQDLVNARSIDANNAGMGKAPPGYRWKPDGSLEPIPNGPADNSAKDAARRQGLTARADLVIDKVDEAMKLVGYSTAGAGGAIAGMIPGTSAVDLRKAVDTIKANIGFQELQAMREASPTGGALGQVAVQELNMLQAVISSLDETQSPAALKASLGKVRQHFLNWKKLMAEANSSGSSGQGGGAQRPADARLRTAPAGSGADYVYTPGR